MVIKILLNNDIQFFFQIILHFQKEINVIMYIIEIFKVVTQIISFEQNFNKIWIFKDYDALPSHGVKPTWGFHKVKLRKVKTWRHTPGFQL
jgi:hypothetical protein